ncbi:MAG: glycoside hydrolase family 15 protein [Pyrinomonadaceae bacterium]
MSRLIIISIISLVSSAALAAQTATELAPGGPGQDAHWPSAAKKGFGTANTLASKVWFTLNDGVMTEVFYPTLDVPNVQTLQLVFVRDGTVQTESEDTVHRIELLDPQALTFRQVNTAEDGTYTITKTYVTDPERSSVLVDVVFRWKGKGPCRCSLYVYYDPSLNNSGMRDSAWLDGAWLVATDGDKASALTVADAGLRDETNGYLGTSDGLTQLRRAGSIGRHLRAVDGNVVQVARVQFPLGMARSTNRFTIVLSFGRDPDEAVRTGQASVKKGIGAARAGYQRGWHEYIKTLRRVSPQHQPQFNIAAMVLKALEDKTYRGAMIASPSVPWGGGPNANESTISGYHAVWSRDLYHVSTAFLAMGDRASAHRALDYLFDVQQKADGSFPQNSWVDGRSIGGGLQMDQVAFPIILAYQLERHDRKTWIKHVKPAADFLLSRGPRTEQERWEEKAGYSPSTIAAEIAGLVCAAHIASLNSDRRSAATYLKKADDWFLGLDSWTRTTTGRHGLQSYYLRLSDDEDSNDGAKIEINSGGGSFDEREIVDAGFLELVRLGIKPAADPSIRNSLKVVDELIRKRTPQGSAWYRYNHDAYGERPDGGPYDGRTGIGRLWTLLSGERGQYELARGNRAGARQHLDAMMRFANEGMMLPEQIWDRRESPRADLRWGTGTGSATPLAWSMAQFIRLAMNLQIGHNSDTPAVVAARYAKRPWAR